jgi:hypothetical protein
LDRSVHADDARGAVNIAPFERSPLLRSKAGRAHETEKRLFLTAGEGAGQGENFLPRFERLLALGGSRLLDLAEEVFVSVAASMAKLRAWRRL